MLKTLFGSDRRSNKVVVDSLYERIVAAARQPIFYDRWDVPDTPLGRYEMLALHIFLFLERTRGEGTRLADVAQELTDEFFKDVEHSLRELGIGDFGVPKRMKKLAKMFYGRAEAYRIAVEASDLEALAASLSRNVRPGETAWTGAIPLASYVLRASQYLDVQTEDELAAGDVVFPEAIAEERLG